jgi:hypothetical protein
MHKCNAVATSTGAILSFCLLFHGEELAINAQDLTHVNPFIVAIGDRLHSIALHAIQMLN